MAISFKRSGDAGVVTLEGELNLPNAAELRKVLIKALLDADDLSIAMKKVQAVDLSCLQLLCSAHRSALRLKKHVAFKGAPPKKFTEAMNEAGFVRYAGCKWDCQKNCLWKTVGGNDK